MPGCYAVFHKQLGDLVLLEPALSRLRDYHGAPVRLLTRSGHADLVRLMPGVEFSRGLAAAPALYCFDPLNKSALRSMCAPVARRCLVVPERAELAWYHRFLFPAPSCPELGESYVAEFFWKNTPCPCPSSFRPPLLAPPPPDWAPDARKPGTFVLVNPTAGWRKKMWTSDGWSAVLQSLGHREFILTNAGADWQAAHCRAIAAASGARILATSMKQFLWLCANASMVLTVDGSASHLAAAFGVPCFTLFGPTSISNWHRPAPGHSAFQAPPDTDGVRRLRKMPPKPVVEAVGQFLQACGRGNE
ncbi:MAG: glycosyltransferase family 9 protein [Verrucomicrobiae bacterium]